MQVKRPRIWKAVFPLLILSMLYAFAIRDKAKSGKEFIGKAVATAERQYAGMLLQSKDLARYPRTVDAKGNTSYVNISDWTGGFWPGDLWYLFELTKKPYLEKEAIKWTESLKANQFNTEHHDLGFMMYCSYGNAYRITKNQAYKSILVQSAKSLISRFNPKVGCIESWNQRASWDGKNNMVLSRYYL